MADKQFGVKQLDILGIGTPTIQSPNDLILNANTVAISTNISVGGISTFTGAITANGTVGIGTNNPARDFHVEGTSRFDQLDVVGFSTFGGSGTKFFHHVPRIEMQGSNTAQFQLTNATAGTTLSDGMVMGFSSGSQVGFINICESGHGFILKTGGTATSAERINISGVGTVSIRKGTTEEMITARPDGAVELYFNGNQKLTTTSTGAEVTGILTATEFIHAFGPGGTSNYGIEARSNSTQNSDTNKAIRVRNNSNTDTFQVSYRGRVDAASFHGDGSGLTNLTETTINSNADNRIITGSDSSNTLNAESNLTFNGSTLAVTGSGSFTGSVSIGGTLTYEDVTNVDSVGVVTAREGIRIGAGKSIGSDGAAVVYYGDGSNLTGLSQAVGGASTIAFNNNVPIYFGDSNDYKIYFNNSKMSFEPTHSGTQQFEMVSNNQMYIHAKASGLFLRANNQEVLSIYGGSGGGVYFRHDNTQKLKLEGGNFTYENGATVTHASHVYIPDSIIHVGDTNTKIRFPAADTFSVETAGSERLRITSNGRVGIGTDDPKRTLHVVDTVGGGIAINGDTSGIQFGQVSMAGASYNAILSRAGSNDDHITGSTPGDLCLAPEKEGAFILGLSPHLGAMTTGLSIDRLRNYDIYFNSIKINTGSPASSSEKLRIDSSGRVLIGTSSVNQNNKIHARLADASLPNASTASVILAENSGNAWITIGSGASNYGGILFADSGSSDVGQVRYLHGENRMEFHTNATERMRIDSNGNLNVTGVCTATHFYGNGANLTGISAFVSGMIILWSGAANAIPSGWVLCNGSNNTPDLRGRFVVGYHDGDGDYDVNDTGGSESVTLTESQMPSHNHTFSGSDSHSHNVSVHNNGNYDFYLAKNLGAQGTSNVSTDSVTVTISGTTGSAGSGNAHENRPPYYALCYIMKT